MASKGAIPFCVISERRDMNTDRFIDVNSVRIRYRDSRGPGPVVFLSHGIGGFVETWDAQFEALGKNFRLVAWDMPGHGQSGFGDQPYDPDKFAALGWRVLDALGIDKAVLVGHSMGGAISLRMSDLAPGRTSGLVLNAAASMGMESPLVFRLFCVPLLGEILSRPGKNGLKQQIKACYAEPERVSSRLQDLILRYSSRPGAQGAFLKTLRRMTNTGGQNAAMVRFSHALLSRLGCPLLIIHGRDDKVIPVRHSEAIMSSVMQAQARFLDACGHVPHEEKPEAFNEVLGSFVLKAG